MGLPRYCYSFCMHFLGSEMPCYLQIEAIGCNVVSRRNLHHICIPSWPLRPCYLQRNSIQRFVVVKIDHAWTFGHSKRLTSLCRQTNHLNLMYLFANDCNVKQGRLSPLCRPNTICIVNVPWHPVNTISDGFPFSSEVKLEGVIPITISLYVKKGTELHKNVLM